MTAKEKNEIAEAKRKAEIAKVRSAAQRLTASKDFMLIYTWLQKRHSFSSSFIAGDEGNTHAAAIRDGQRRVVSDITKLISLPLDVEFDEGEVITRPLQAVSELSQPTPTQAP